MLIPAIFASLSKGKRYNIDTSINIAIEPYRMKKILFTAFLTLTQMTTWAGNGKLVDSVVYFNYEDARFKRDNNYKIANSYDEKGRLSEMIRSEWNDSLRKTVPHLRARYAYDANDSIIKVEQSFADSATNTWTCSMREISAFDLDRRRTLTERYLLENGVVAVSSKKNTFEFSGNNLVSHTSYIWDSGSKSWQASDKEIHEYSSENALVSDIKLRYKDENWVELSKSVYTYTNSLKTEKIESAATTDGWKDSVREQWAYTGTLCSTYIRQKWSNSAWQEQERSVFEYNEDEFCISKNRTTPSEKEIVQWDNNQNITLREVNKYYAECDKWVLALKTEYARSYNSLKAVTEIKQKHISYSINPCYPSSYFPDSKYECNETYIYDSANVLKSKLIGFSYLSGGAPFERTDYAYNEADGIGTQLFYTWSNSQWQLQKETFTYYRTSADTVPAPVQIVFPNPFANQLSVTIAGTETGEIMIYDANAMLLLKTELDPPTSVIETSSLPKGIYYVKVSDSNGTNTYKVLKQ